MEGVDDCMNWLIQGKGRDLCTVFDLRRLSNDFNRDNNSQRYCLRQAQTDKTSEFILQNLKFIRIQMSGEFLAKTIEF
ncbi:MAG: hypothetical protein ACJAZY_000963 [Spirosomataceae bacterium]|jgi:hypothetical protein